MKTTTVSCDISDMEKHEGVVSERKINVVFFHDQEDGRSEALYMETHTIDICTSCYKYMLKNRRMIECDGVMGHNKYLLK